MSEENSGLIPVTDHELFQATTARGFEPGQVIFNRFVLTRVLGRGGMGIVWLAHDKQLEQDVAIKVLPDIVMHDKEAVGDMKRETKRSLQLNHHNIVRIYDFNQDEKGAGISMEFVDGETLSAAKAERPNGCFDVEDVGPWLEQICEALAYAHNTAKIVHRDLKPANIMLSKNNTIKVTDFGIARSISDSISRVSMRHASSGTMVYMSPQQSSGARSSSSDDIYALGATIYDLLTGKPPFYSGNIQHQLENIVPPRMADRRIELERHGNPIPEIWEIAVASCLEKEPSRRPQSVQELAQYLGLRVTTPIAAPVPAAAIAPAAPSYERTIPESQFQKTLPAAAGAPPTSYPPYSQPEMAPSPGWFTPDKMKWIAIAAGCLVGLGVIGALFMLLGRGSGSVSVSTMPPGATVTIGDAKLTSPATFDAIPSGNVNVDIALDGYDPVELPAQVTKNQRTDLGLSTLKRSTGLLAITVIPKEATCTLRLEQSAVPSEPATVVATFPGATQWQSSPLKTGKYELVTAASGFADGHEEIDIKRGDTQQVVVDLVKDEAIHTLAPDEAAAVNSGQPLPDKFKQDASAKQRLTDYYQKMFQGYLKAGQYDLAESQLKHLSSDLGVATTDEQKQLDDGRLVSEKGQGTLNVKTSPAGAAVTVDGKTLGSPAIFEKILAGTKTVSVKLAGYDPVELPAQISRDSLTDLGTVNLTRSTGAVEITAIPRKASCTFKLVHSDSPTEQPAIIASFSGPDSYKAPTLGTGTYEVSATADGFQSATKNIVIKKGDNIVTSIDLVKESAIHLLSPDQVAAVDSDQPLPDAMKQDPAKTALTNYYQQTFQGYLQLKEFKLAESQLKHLKGDLGMAADDDQKQLDQLQTEWLTTEKTNLNLLIQQEKFAAADALLADMESHGPQPELRDALNKAKTDHEASVTKALSDVDAMETAGNEPGAYQAAVAAADKDKIEPRLALKVATLELPMPSTYERVTNRVKALTALQASDPNMAQNADFTRLLDIFQKNVQRHDSFRSQFAVLKKQVDSYDGKIASLRADAKHNEDKANGYKALSILGIAGGATGAGFNNAPGAVAGFGTGIIGANGATARTNDVRADQARIGELQSQQAEKQQQLNALREQYETMQKSPINAVQ
jgi:serine/threonine protein kinase